MYINKLRLLLVAVIINLVFNSMQVCAQERPGWLPAEFNTPEELVEAYHKLLSEHLKNLPSAKQELVHSRTLANPLPSAASAPEPPGREKQTSRLYSVSEDTKASASDSNDFSISLGTKFWVNNWATGQLTPGYSSSDNISSFISSSGSVGVQSALPVGEQVASIPFGSVRYKDFFVTGSYYTPTSFGITQQTQVDFNFPQLLGISDKETFSGDVKRSEWDVSLGWLVFPNIALTAGYKEINMDINYLINHAVAYSSTPYAPLNQTLVAKNTIHGPTLGLAGSIPIGRYWFGTLGLYGSYAHGFMTSAVKYSVSGVSQNSASADTDYDALEGGVTYTFGDEVLPAFLPMFKSSMFAGYRMQRVSVTGAYGPFDTGTAEITQGFTTGVNLIY